MNDGSHSSAIVHTAALESFGLALKRHQQDDAAEALRSLDPIQMTELAGLVEAHARATRQRIPHVIRALIDDGYDSRAARRAVVDIAFASNVGAIDLYRAAKRTLEGR